MKTLEEVLSFVGKLHIDQFDRAGEPYINHLVRVMEGLPAEFATHDNKVIALFHDSFEDRWFRLLEWSGGKDPYEWLIEEGYLNEYSVSGLKLLTHTEDDGMTYMEYVENIANSGHMGALYTKLSDNTDNSDLERVARIIDPEKRASHMEMAKGRYARARKILLKALDK